jgi:hypothetical protein
MIGEGALDGALTPDLFDSPINRKFLFDKPRCKARRMTRLCKDHNL